MTNASLIWIAIGAIGMASCVFVGTFGKKFKVISSRLALSFILIGTFLGSFICVYLIFSDKDLMGSLFSGLMTSIASTFSFWVLFKSNLFH